MSRAARIAEVGAEMLKPALVLIAVAWVIGQFEKAADDLWDVKERLWSLEADREIRNAPESPEP